MNQNEIIQISNESSLNFSENYSFFIGATPITSATKVPTTEDPGTFYSRVTTNRIIDKLFPTIE